MPAFAAGAIGRHEPEVGPDRGTLNRLQSPTSTAGPNAVSVETPRMHRSRDTVGHHCGSWAISMIALSSRARREVASSTVSSVVS